MTYAYGMVGDRSRRRGVPWRDLPRGRGVSLGSSRGGCGRSGWDGRPGALGRPHDGRGGMTAEEGGEQRRKRWWRRGFGSLSEGRGQRSRGYGRCRRLRSRRCVARGRGGDGRQAGGVETLCGRLCGSRLDLRWRAQAFLGGDGAGYRRFREGGREPCTVSFWCGCDPRLHENRGEQRHRRQWHRWFVIGAERGRR